MWSRKLRDNNRRNQSSKIIRNHEKKRSRSTSKNKLNKRGCKSNWLFRKNYVNKNTQHFSSPFSYLIKLILMIYK